MAVAAAADVDVLADRTNRCCAVCRLAGVLADMVVMGGCDVDF